MSNIRKYHNQPMTRNINCNKTSGGQFKQRNYFSLPRQDDCKTRKDTKQFIPKQRKWEVHKTINQQQQNHRLRMGSSLSHLEGLNAFYRRKSSLIIMLSKQKNCFARMEASLLMQCIITEKQSNQINTL